MATAGVSELAVEMVTLSVEVVVPLVTERVGLRIAGAYYRGRTRRRIAGGIDVHE